MKTCLECGIDLDEDMDEMHYTDDGDGPFCDDCIDEVLADRAQVARQVA